MQEKSGNISIIHLPHRVQSFKRLYPLGRDKNWKPFTPQETTGPWHGKQGKDFSLIPSVSTYLPIPGSYKCQRDKHLCVGTSPRKSSLCTSVLLLLPWRCDTGLAHPRSISHFPAGRWQRDTVPFWHWILQIEGNGEEKRKKLNLLFNFV